jgi:DNA-binding response OmpR family regulator
LRSSSRRTTSAGRGRGQRRRSILVVDDSALINRITEMILTQAGYRVRCIASPFELYDKTKEEPADLVLVDYNMPLRGDKVIDVARRAGVTAPMILYSNAPEEELRSAVRACGASGFIKKGVPSEEVVRQLADVFARLDAAT